MDNVHTYAHARRVRNAPRDTKSRYQTFLWPTSQPPPSQPDFKYKPSSFGPPVRTVEDLIAYHYLSIHRPDVFKLSTSTVLDSVSDREFDAYEERKKQEARSRFEEKYCSYTSKFDHEVARQKTSKVKKQSKQTPKRSKYFDDVTSPSQDTWRSTSSSTVEEVTIHYAEEFIVPACSQSIVEHQVSHPVRELVVTSLPQSQCATITCEVKDELQERPLCCQQSCDGTQSISTVNVVRWSKRSTSYYSPKFRRSRRLNMHGRRSIVYKYNIKSDYILALKFLSNTGNKEPYKNGYPYKYVPCALRVMRNFKKRRRKCESEHAY